MGCKRTDVQIPKSPCHTVWVREVLSSNLDFTTKADEFPRPLNFALPLPPAGAWKIEQVPGEEEFMLQNFVDR